MSTEMPQVKRLFMLLHGMYGNKLLDMYRTGQTNGAGEDTGILSAQAVWLNGLREFEFDTVRAAVARCDLKHKTWPPSLPEFRDLCKAAQPKSWTPTNAPQLPMSDELKAEIKQRNRLAIEGLKAARTGAANFGAGLPALMLMVARAIGDAGGDEVRCLLQLESRFQAEATGA